MLLVDDVTHSWLCNDEAIFRLKAKNFMQSRIQSVIEVGIDDAVCVIVFFKFSIDRKSAKLTIFLSNFFNEPKYRMQQSEVIKILYGFLSR